MNTKYTNPSFLESFENEPSVEQDLFVGDPPLPSSFTVTRDSIANYQQTFVVNNNSDYGLTGVCFVDNTVAWPSVCYNSNGVAPGTIFLFPGTNDDENSDFVGNCSINCSPHAPIYMDGSGITLHGQLCKLLGQVTGNFVGFAVILNASGQWGLGPNSGTCNPKWFGGNRALSALWSGKIVSALNKVLKT